MAFNILLVVLITLLPVLSRCQSAGCGGNSCPEYEQCQKYTYFTLAVQDWCNNGNWSIHGLWPNYKGDCWPQYCHDPDWVPVTGQLEQEMLQYWNWCDNNIGDQQGGWEHEWKRHGTCMEYYNSSLSQNGFFREALDIFEALLFDGTVEEKCGSAGKDSSCYDVCVDLDGNSMDCPEDQVIVSDADQAKRKLI